MGVNGAQEIKNHEFFHDIDFTKLMQKRLKPPTKPKVVSDFSFSFSFLFLSSHLRTLFFALFQLSSVDTSNFDRELTTQQPTDSLVEGSKLSESVQKKFDGFTYVNDSKMTYAQTPVFGKSLMH